MLTQSTRKDKEAVGMQAVRLDLLNHIKESLERMEQDDTPRPYSYDLPSIIAYGECRLMLESTPPLEEEDVLTYLERLEVRLDEMKLGFQRGDVEDEWCTGSGTFGTLKARVDFLRYVWPRIRDRET